MQMPRMMKMVKSFKACKLARRTNAILQLEKAGKQQVVTIPCKVSAQETLVKPGMLLQNAGTDALCKMN